MHWWNTVQPACRRSPHEEAMCRGSGWQSQLRSDLRSQLTAGISSQMCEWMRLQMLSASAVELPLSLWVFPLRPRQQGTEIKLLCVVLSLNFWPWNVWTCKMQHMIIPERLNKLPKVIQLVSGEARISIPNHLTLKASILNHQVMLLLWLQHQEATCYSEDASWTTFQFTDGVDGWAWAGTIPHGVNPGSVYPMSVLCVVSISNIIPWP